MTNWNLVWLQPKTNLPSYYYYCNEHQRTFVTEPPSDNEQKIIENLQRPTKSSLAKRDPASLKRFNIPNYMEGDRHSWSRMEYFGDCHTCLYNSDGSLRTSSKK